LPLSRLPHERHDLGDVECRIGHSHCRNSDRHSHEVVVVEVKEICYLAHRHVPLLLRLKTVGILPSEHPNHHHAAKKPPDKLSYGNSTEGLFQTIASYSRTNIRRNEREGHNDL
jgi:hypothetical protein